MNELLPPEAAAVYLKLSKGWLAKLRVTGDGPVYIKLKRLIRYRIADLDGWVERRRRTSASDARS